MRKWIAIVVAFILILLLIYWIVPAQLEVHQNTIVAVKTTAFTRQIFDEQKWQWWPGTKANSKPTSAMFEYHGNSYTVLQKKLTSLVIEVSNEKDSILTELFFIPIQSDSIQLNWVGIQKTRLNPLNRVKKRSWIRGIDADMNFILEKIKSFYSDEDNVYGFHIEKTIVAYSNYMFTSLRTKTYPSTELIYESVEKLKHYIQMNNAQPTGFPMLNIYRNNDSSYITKLALPVNKQLKNSGDIQYRWMLKGGNILVTEVRGGPYKIERAFSEIQNYVQDHQRIAPAIPFQSLITDRRAEPDTNRWVTKIYWPVM